MGRKTRGGVDDDELALIPSSSSWTLQAPSYPLFSHSAPLWFSTPQCIMVRGWVSFILVMLVRDPVSLRVKLGDGSHTAVGTAKF